jgi:hypothetical protein
MASKLLLSASKSPKVQYVEMFGIVWNLLEFYGILWNMEFYRIWNFMEYGISWNYIKNI